MAIDMFLNIKDVKGESIDATHKDEIDILGWSWGMSQSGTMHMAQGGGSGKVSVQDLSVTKYVDRSSPTLIKMCCGGDHFEECKLTVRKAGGKKPVEYVILTLKKVLVSSISTGGSGGEDRLTENVVLNFQEFKMEYTPQDDKGAAGAAIPAGWNIAKNEAV